MTMYEPDLDDDTPDQEPENETPQNNSFKQLRDHAKKLEKDLKNRDKELEDLRTFKTELERKERESGAKEKFKTLGLAEKQAELFLTKNPEGEVTEESVRQFAVEYGLVESTPDDEPGFSPAPPEGLPAGGKQLTADEFWTLHKENPTAAIAAAKSGRVSFDTKL